MGKLMIDSDVMINWLAQEGERDTDEKLWVAPAIILELGETKQLENLVSLLSIFEIRFVLRRKKNWDFAEIEHDLSSLSRILKIAVPDQQDLWQAHHLQGEQPLDPFDSILLSQCIHLQAALITRDKRLIDIASKYTTCFTPEAYLDHISETS